MASTTTRRGRARGAIADSPKRRAIIHWLDERADDVAERLDPA